VRKVFVSYSHAQGEWVLDRLVPCLRAGGAEVLIDVERFRTGGGLYRQMDAVQDLAERQVLVLSAAYLASTPCQHEMQRAIALDPRFEHHIVQPVRRDDTPLPSSIKLPDPLYVDLRDDSKPAPWAALLRECDAALGTTAPHWLAARDEVRRKLLDHRSVNLVVPDRGVKWRELILDLETQAPLKFPRIDLDSGEAASRRHLIETILRRLGLPDRVPASPGDLPVLTRALLDYGLTRLTLVHFDRATGRPGYDENLHAALRHLAFAERKLVLLVHSRAPFASLLPGWDVNSEAFMTMVELQARAT
jgi:hypothetical protein